MRSHLVVWSLLSLACACSRVAQPSEASMDAGKVRSVRSVAAVESAKAATVAAPPRKPKEAELQLVRELDCDEAYLHVLPTKTFLSCGQRLLTVEGTEVRQAPDYQRGIEPEEPAFLWQIASIAGQWPDAAWLGTNRSTESAAQGRVYHWTGQRWARAADAKADEPLSALLPWADQCVLALVQPPNTFGARFIPLGKTAFKVPSFTAPKMPHEHCVSRMRAEVQTAVAPGEIMVAGGQVCDVVSVHGQKDTIHSGIGVERFTAGESQGKLMLLQGLPDLPPRAVWQVTALVAVVPGKVLLAAHSVLDGGRTVGHLARWDGKAFRPEPLPFAEVAEGIRGLWVESQGALWATDLRGQLWRSHARSWKRVPWQPPDPEDTEITRVWVRAPSDVWVLTRRLSQSRSAVFHGRVEWGDH